VPAPMRPHQFRTPLRSGLRTVVSQPMKPCGEVLGGDNVDRAPRTRGPLPRRSWRGSPRRPSRTGGMVNNYLQHPASNGTPGNGHLPVLRDSDRRETRVPAARPCHPRLARDQGLVRLPPAAELLRGRGWDPTAPDFYRRFDAPRHEPTATASAPAASRL
jgi:hypothetical protein